MKIPLLSILLISSCLQLEAIRSSASSPAVSEAFCNPRSNCRRSYAGRNALRSLDEHSTKWSRSSSQLSFATSIHSQDDQYRHNNSLFGRKYCMASSISLHQTTTNSFTTTTLSLRYALNRIRQFMTNKWSQGLKLLRILTIASILLVPSIASASSSSPSSYYLQGNSYQTTHQQATARSEISIQTQPSQPYSNSNSNTVTARRQYPQTTRFVKQRNKTTSSLTQTQKVKRTTLFVMLLTLAASSFRASLRKSKVVRNVTPFGTIRNVSPLGNGVSVIRVCMALKVDGNDEAKRLLNKLYLEEKELYTNISMLSQDDPRVQQPQQQLSGAYSFRQQALGRYVSNVASTFLQYTNCIRYGNIESIRVPFVEDAVKEFRQVAKEERQVFAATAATQKRKKNVMPEEPKKEKVTEKVKEKVQRQEEEDDGTNAKKSNSNKKKSGYILLQFFSRSKAIVPVSHCHLVFSVKEMWVEHCHGLPLMPRWKIVW
eukprot:scaffold10312_cov141-Skeletonema_marinoi.AAC.5